MMLLQLHLWFLLANFLLLLCPKTCRAAAYEQRVISVLAQWQPEVYKNDNTEKVTREIIHTTGMKSRRSNTRMIEATHTVGAIAKGELFMIVSLQFSYSFAHRTTSATMLETEIYESRSIKTTMTIPPRSTLTRWELVADVAGAKVGYRHYIDVLNNTQRPTSDPTSRAKVLMPRRINYGHTRIRIKHLNRNEYVTVIQRNSWPAAALGHSSRYLFVLCQDSRGIRIKTLNTTHPGYVWAYSSKSGGVYFDWHRQIGSSYDKNADKQHWTISKEGPLYDGDVVTFKNRYYDDSGMSYHEGSAANVYCLAGREDKWVLAIADERDSPSNNC